MDEKQEPKFNLMAALKEIEAEDADGDERARGKAAGPSFCDLLDGLLRMLRSRNEGPAQMLEFIRRYGSAAENEILVAGIRDEPAVALGRALQRLDVGGKSDENTIQTLIAMGSGPRPVGLCVELFKAVIARTLRVVIEHRDGKSLAIGLAVPSGSETGKLLAYFPTSADDVVFHDRGVMLEVTTFMTLAIVLSYARSKLGDEYEKIIRRVCSTRVADPGDASHEEDGSADRT